MGVTPHHFRRLLRRFEAEGDTAAIHALRGRRSNRALPREVRERALAVAADPLYRDFGPTLLAEHLQIRCELRVSADTLRRWMMEAGLWERARRRSKHRSRLSMATEECTLLAIENAHFSGAGAVGHAPGVAMNVLLRFDRQESLDWQATWTATPRQVSFGAHGAANRGGDGSE